MQFKDKINQSVAEAVSRIMNEKLHPNQQKIDVVDDEKIDGKDFAKLRKMKKEEVEQVEEGMSHQAATTMKHIPNASPALKKAAKDIKPGVSGYQDRAAMLKAGGVKEQVEELDEVKMADLPSTKVQGRSYGASKPQPSAFDVLKGPKDKELKSIETEKKKPVKEDVEVLDEKLSASADAGDYIRDFKKSDAPQFQGKSPEKRRIMGIAAYLSSKKGK